MQMLTELYRCCLMHTDVPMEDDASLLEVAASVTAAGTVFREYQPSSLHPAARSHWKKPGCCFLPAEIGIFIKMASKAEL